MTKRQALRITGAINTVPVFLAEGEGCISYTTTRENSIKELIIEGNMEYSNGTQRPVGIATDDGTIIKLRIRGETVLDGHELERIMKERGSPCYGGVVDDDHFLYIARDDGSYTLVDRTDMYIPNGLVSLIGDAILYDTLPSGKTATGIQIVTANGNRAVSFGGTEGTVSFSGQNGNSFYNYGLSHKAVESEFVYAIAYDSLRLVQNGKVTNAPYNGYTREIKLSSGLYRIVGTRGNDVFDELDVLEGVVTRRTEMVMAKECEMSIIYYEGVLAFKLTMPSRIGEGSVNSTRLSEMDEYNFADEINCFIVSPDRKSLYIHLQEDITTVEEARARIGASHFLYPLAEEKTEKVTPPDISQESGTCCIEVCSVTPPTIYAMYEG